MFKKVSLVSTIVLPLICAACVTGIKVTRLAGNPASVTGNPWNLPMTQFKITLTRHVVGCGSSIQSSLEVMVTSGLAIDPEQRYLLRSKGIFATSDITSTLSPTGISTGLNAQSTDSTATVISNVVSTIASVAVLAAAAGAPPDGHAATPEFCKPPVLQAVNELYHPDPASHLKPLKARVDDDTAALAKATAKVTLLTAKAAINNTLRPQLLGAMDAQSALQTQLGDEQAQLTKDMNLTTDTQVVTWPLQSKDFRQDQPYKIDKQVFKRWASDAVDTLEGIKKFDVYLALYRYSIKDNHAAWLLPPKPETADVTVGVPVRLAATGRLLVCLESECEDFLATDGPSNPLRIANDFQVLQLGLMYVVPVTGGTFKSESAIIALDPTSGLPTSIATSEKAAAAAGLSGSAKDTATQFAALPASVRAAQLAKTQAESNQRGDGAAGTAECAIDTGDGSDKCSGHQPDQRAGSANIAGKCTDRADQCSRGARQSPGFGTIRKWSRSATRPRLRSKRLQPWR